MKIWNLFKRAVRQTVFLPGIYNIFVKLFKNTAITGKGSSICLKNGFLAVPVNYHSPIPDIEDLKQRDVWRYKSDLIGIDFREDEQIKLLKKIGLSYGEECQWPLASTSNPIDFYLTNPSFSYGCAASTYSMIRHFKPQRIIEIGSGMSSMVIAQAMQANKKQFNESSYEYVVIDPFPREFIQQSLIEMTQFKRKRVELIDTDFFSKLDHNDILFIDSGHCVKIGSDVNFLYLHVIPRLNPGVIIHIHDISLPYEYSRTYATNEAFRQFWTEQYLLQSFLCFNKEFEILLAMTFLMTDHPDVFQDAFPHYNAQIHNLISSSFWIRRRNLL